jgi:hypothetical protein
MSRPHTKLNLADVEDVAAAGGSEIDGKPAWPAWI